MTDTDIRALLGVFRAAQPAAADDIFYADVLTGLRELIPCEEIGFQLMDVAEQRCRLMFVTDEGVQRLEEVGANDEFQQLWWQEFWEVGGFAGPLATGDYSTLLQQAELCSPRSWADTPLGFAYAELGITCQILVPMTPLSGTDRRLALWRNQDMPDFSEREKAMLALVRPHLAELHVRRDRELRGVPRLTPRQWEVLRQVARGASNTQIARTARTLGRDGAQTPRERLPPPRRAKPDRGPRSRPCIPRRGLSRRHLNKVTSAAVPPSPSPAGATVVDR